MAYVPDSEHDVFVSYAHLDNVGPEGDTRRGWVDTFIERLSIQVRRRLGSNAVDIWTDREHAGHQALTPTLLRAVRGSALLLVVMSPSYLSSLWCARERNTFLELANDRVAEGRVFIVNYLDVAIDSRPREFGDLTGFPFWIVDRAYGATRPLGESDPTEAEFVGRLYALSQHVANELRRLAATAYGSTRTIEVAKSSALDGILVARATDDLEERERELRNHFLQAGLQAPPRRLYMQATAQEFETAVMADLQHCKVFVQLLSAARGPEMVFESAHRLPGRLFEVARRSGVKIMQWRDGGLDLDSIADPTHRGLLEGAMACSIEEFKRLAVDEARRVPVPARSRPAKVLVFVDADPGDRELARAVGETLTREGVRCYFPLDAGTPEQIRKDVEANLHDCDGVLIVYGTCEVDAVRTKLRHDGKILSQRDEPPATLAVFEGPPAQADKLKRLLASMMDPDVMVIGGADGVSAERLRPFVARLRGG